MWTLHESYDPATHVVYLDLVSEPAVPPRYHGLAEPKILEAFMDVDDARKFADGYLKSLAYGKDKVVRQVLCGQHRRDGCSGPGKSCYLGLNASHCKILKGE